jgi:formylglycine-generating enzyme required for sulfatase activity
MPDLATLRIFISSPSDVRPERLKAEQIVRRLDREFAYHFRVEPMLWEREPLVAAHHFQDPENIPRPRGTDIVVVILWSRLGVPLPADRFRGAISGRSPVTGTEWEFEDALAGARERGVPDLLLYRKTASPTATLDDRKALEERLEQLDLVDAFIGRWFRRAGDESFTAASHSFATTAEFEGQLYGHLHALLARRTGGVAAGGVSIRWHEAPFRALLPYEYEHAPVFFGRTHARNELRELLARQIDRGLAFILLFGASGAGKSSLVKAGLLPDLALPGMIGRVALVRRALMRPSDAPGGPLDGLAAAILAASALPELAELRYTRERLCALLRKAPEEASVPIEQGLAAAAQSAGLSEIAQARLALVVDQLEEIFTVETFGQGEREAFVAALGALSKSGLVWIVATMRSDFFDRLETVPPLAALSAGEARFLLPAPDEAEIGEIIRRPAQEAGSRFEHDAARGLSLDEEIRRAAARDREALPLLSFVLDQLWQRRSAAGLLTFAAYRELGGLEGAIGERAEAVFQAQPEAVQREFVPVLHALVSVRGATATARAASLALFPEGSPRRALVEAFLHPEARLLVGDDEAGQAHIRLAHEALLTHWPRARDQVAADARDLELRGRLEEAAEHWQATRTRRGQRGRVATGLMLAEARELLARRGADLPELVRQFIAASRRTARWRLFRLAATVAAAPAALALVAFLVWGGIVWRGAHRVEVEWGAERAFVRIPAGCFEMGSAANRDKSSLPNERPAHRVCLKAFELDKFDVTEWEWRQLMYPFDPDPSYFKGDRQPVEQVSWNDAWWFIHLMSWFGGQNFRLPSEAEWEYAARAGTVTRYFWGDRAEDGCAYAKMADANYKNAVAGALAVNCHYHHVRGTEPVGSFKPNAWGLYDMLGDVAQWVEDCYADDYRSAPKDASTVTSKNCRTRVIRGGSWKFNPRDLRAAARSGVSPAYRVSLFGFRVVRVVAP